MDRQWGTQASGAKVGQAVRYTSIESQSWIGSEVHKHRELKLDRQWGTQASGAKVGNEKTGTNLKKCCVKECMLHLELDPNNIIFYIGSFVLCMFSLREMASVFVMYYMFSLKEWFCIIYICMFSLKALILYYIHMYVCFP